VEYYLNGAFKDCKLTLSNSELERYLAQSQATLTVSASEGRVEKLAERVRQHIAAQSGVKP
jgi:hypothetical protein